MAPYQRAAGAHAHTRKIVAPVRGVGYRIQSPTRGSHVVDRAVSTRRQGIFRCRLCEELLASTAAGNGNWPIPITRTSASCLHPILASDEQSVTPTWTSTIPAKSIEQHPDSETEEALSILNSAASTTALGVKSSPSGPSICSEDSSAKPHHTPVHSSSQESQGSQDSDSNAGVEAGKMRG